MTVAGGRDRPALVLLHFFGGSARSWNPLLAALKGEHEALALDLPGFGAAQAASGPYSVTAYADFVEAAIDAKRLRNFLLVGHSMGSKIALALAARRPAGLRGLVLLAPSPPTPEPIGEKMREKLIAGWGCYGPASETLARVTGRALGGALRERVIADMMNTSKAAWNAWLEAGSREDISDAMAAIDVSALILSGDCDTALPPDLVEREVSSRLRKAQFALVPGAGHLLPIEAPQAVAALLRGFVEDGIGGPNAGSSKIAAGAAT